jgi:ergothioneine biosynthesis protein EgtB
MLDDYKEFHPLYNYIFNSYYDSVGERVLRADRGNLTRPSVEEIMAYRKHVDENMEKLILQVKDEQMQQFKTFFEIGLQHEQQHQELLVTDIKYILGHNPLQSAYVEKSAAINSESKHFSPIQYMEMPAGMYEIGYNGNDFAWDNEMPKHKVYLQNFKVANRLVTNGEYLEFMQDGGYEDFRFWLSDGWQLVEAKKWFAPLYWHQIEEKWQYYTLIGSTEIDMNEPVTHISFYEADAYASWAGKRLLTEFEWEAASQTAKNGDGNFLESNNFHPAKANEENGLQQMFGDCWEWTYSGYFPYPGYKRAEGPLGEYNGKFMINQMVLRGGSCATPKNHFRPTYRNFFQPPLRWQFTGIRLGE